MDAHGENELDRNEGRTTAQPVPAGAPCYDAADPVSTAREAGHRPKAGPGDGQRQGQADGRTDRVPTIDAGELFAEDANEATVITTLPYELRPRYTGRAAALEALGKAFDDTRDLGELSFVVLIGEPGMGKSRTVKELAKTLKRDEPDARVLIGAGDDSGVAYAAFGRLLAARFGITPGESPASAQEKIIAGVAEVLPAARVTEVAHLLAQLLRVPFADSAVVGPLVESPQQLEARTFIAMRRFFAADASAGPLVLCFENLEQCGPETINLLHYLAAGLASSPVMILGTAREAVFERYPSFGDGDVPLVRLDLGALGPEESEALLRELCKPLDEVPPALLSQARKLGGSPRALFELIRLLLESDVIVRSGGMSWMIDRARLATFRFPQTYEQLVAERLRVMDPVERDHLENAAVIGEAFWLDAVVALSRLEALASNDPDGPTLGEIAASGDHSRAAVATALAKLVEREWIYEVRESSVPGEREYRFAYPNLWATVYEAVPETKRHCHKMVAQWLELRPEGRAAIAQEDVARHLELAGDAAGAAQRYRRAADLARANFFNDRAIRLYSHALECIGESDLAARIHLWHDLGSVYELKGDFEAALGAFERMLRLAWVGASRTKAAVAFNKMGRVWRRKGDLKLALEYLERGAELFDQAGDARGIAGSLDDIGKVLYLLGRYDEAFEKVTAGLARRGKGGDKRSIASSLSSLGNIQKDRGRFSEAYNCHQEALELRRGVGDRWGVSVSQNNLAVLAFELGDLAAARRGWEQALSEAEDIGALPLAALALSNMGELALMEGRHEEARRRLDDALDIAEDIDDRRLQVETTRNLALLESAVGNATRARELARHAHGIAAEAGLRDNEGRALLTLGEVFAGSLFDAEATDEDDGAAEGRPAEEYFERGLELLREIGNESEVAKGLEQYGRYKIEQGQFGAGKDLLREALVIFTRLGMSRAREVEKVLAAV
jgi:tetratricopeptide (TPR) repeat protein